MWIPISLALLAVTTSSIALGAEPTRDLRVLEHDYYLMEHYRLIYSREVFDYCVQKHGTVARAAGSCMMKQERQKKRILREALEQLGTQSAGQLVWGDCLDYYPNHSAVRIGHCVRTRLDLNEKLEDESVEKKIYHACDMKWREHGYRSIDNCSTTQARYFLRSGKLPD